MTQLRELLSFHDAAEIINRGRLIAVNPEQTVATCTSAIDIQLITRRLDQLEALLARKYPRAARDAELGVLIDGIRDEIPPFGPAEATA